MSVSQFVKHSNGQSNCVLLQSWLYKLRGDGTRQFAHIGGAWRKKYFVLIRDYNKPCLLYFNKKPDLSRDMARGCDFGVLVCESISFETVHCLFEYW